MASGRQRANEGFPDESGNGDYFIVFPYSVSFIQYRVVYRSGIFLVNDCRVNLVLE